MPSLVAVSRILKTPPRTEITIPVTQPKGIRFLPWRGFADVIRADLKEMSPGVPGGPSVITGIFTSREPPPAQTWSERRGEEMRLQGKPELHCVRRIRPILAGCENAGRICKPRNAGSLRRLRRTRQRHENPGPMMHTADFCQHPAWAWEWIFSLGSFQKTPQPCRHLYFSLVTLCAKFPVNSAGLLTHRPVR